MKKKSLNLKSNLFLGKEVITPLGQNASMVYGGDDTNTCGITHDCPGNDTTPGVNQCQLEPAPTIIIACGPTPPTGYLVETNCCGAGGNSQNVCPSFKCGVSQ